MHAFTPTMEPGVLPFRQQLKEIKVARKTADSAALLALYDGVARTGLEAVDGQMGDAEIFERVHAWSFSDFSKSASDFVGISEPNLLEWQARHHINLSSGTIRPNPVDLRRGYAWGQVRLEAATNHLRSEQGPPSEAELDALGM